MGLNGFHRLGHFLGVLTGGPVFLLGVLNGMEGSDGTALVLILGSGGVYAVVWGVCAGFGWVVRGFRREA